ncbi:DUF1822 family protein [Tychonema sp. BBK16]|uniref:DUF1822 family protein n=1 Tax=Tychonema sp. BBK16 TaxID=2699888 RepID=UPI001F19933A|nr:DUF1822 family protein [Tychonema sp. BBK16]MCF6373204.1 DUF1822 family protein [Tychonema sp. BBK16]
MENQSLPMPITQKAIRSAWQFASAHHHPQKAEQIYLNTLAVLAVKDYLQVLDIETDLTECDSWNSTIRMFEDTADLYITGLGKVECRPIRSVHQQVKNSNQKFFGNSLEMCPVPIEATEERIGYIVVEIDEDQKEARLLGFSPTAEMGELALSDLGSLDDFLMHLEYLSESKVNLRQWLEKIYTSDWESIESVFNIPPKTVPVEIENPVTSHLRNWLKNATETGRQKFEETKQNVEDLLFSDNNLIPAYRGGVHSSDESASGGDRTSINKFPKADATRAKLIDLGMRLGRTTVALLVAIAEESDRTLKVYVQLHPAIGERYLPRNIKLSLISDIGKNLSESQSRIQDKYIVLKDIEVDRDESFSIRVALDDFSVMEKFMV